MKTTLAVAVSATVAMLQGTPDCFPTLVGDEVTFECTNCGPTTEDTFIVQEDVAELVLFNQLEVDVEASTLRINWIFQSSSIISDLNLVWSDLDWTIPGEIVGVTIDPSSTWGIDAFVEFTADSVSLVNNSDVTVAVGDFWLAHLEVRVEPGCHTLDFETDDEGRPLVHGQHLDDGDPEFDCGASFPVTITSSVNASNLPTAAILDSDTGPAAQDPDLLVGRGNILILQTDANLSECPPASGIYCSHNDDEDGGTLSFAFPGPTTPSSVVLIDIDSSDGTSTVVLTDGSGAQRTYTVPANWTGDFMSDGPPGWKLLDLTDTNGQIGFGSTATAVEDAGFDPTDVLQIDIHLAGSGGVDDLSWCDTSVAVQPSVQPRNGSGVNHVILSSTSLPLIGGTWAANLDCRGLGSGLATLTVCRRATSGTMTPFGEQLIAGVLFLRSSQVFAGSVSQFTWDIPNDPALLGLDLHAQGLCWSSQGALEPKSMRARKGLSNALDLILGF